jgi:leucyl-tRNA synthetase
MLTCVILVKVCEQLNITRPDQSEELYEAKAQVYQKGFYEGIMLVGEFKGRYVKFHRVFGC